MNVNGEKTVVADDEKTVVADDEKTVVADDEKTLAVNVSPAAESTKGLKAVKEGDVIEGYSLEKIIYESGGEASIWIADKDGSKAIVKIYRSGREIATKVEETLKSIGSESIMPILGSGEFKKRHYQILPYYKNGTLRDRLGSIEIDFILDVVIPQVNEGLKAIHEHDLFHNDIKPSNIFVCDDERHVVIGDFGITVYNAERTSVTNIGNLSPYYAAPDARDHFSVKTDYFSFGRTLLTIAFGKEIYATAKEAMHETSKGRLIIPKEIPSDLADLIYMLTLINPAKRIAGKGVDDWIKDHRIYSGCREDEENEAEELHIQEVVFKVDGKDTKFHDAFKLAKAMNENQALAIRYYNNNLIIPKIMNANEVLGLELTDIRARYSDNPELGLIVTLHVINKSLPLIFRDMNVSSFKEFIEFLEKKNGENCVDYCDKDLLDIVCRKKPLSKESSDVLEHIASHYKGQERVDAILNCFKKEKSFYFNGKKHDDYGSFLADECLNNLGDPLRNFIDDDREFFYPLLLTHDGVSKNVMQEVKHLNDRRKRYFAIEKAYLGHLSFFVYETRVINLNEFLSALWDLYENYSHEKGLDPLIKFLDEDGFHLVCEFEEKPVDNDLLDLVNREKGLGRFFALYHYTSPKNTIGYYSDPNEYIANLISGSKKPLNDIFEELKSDLDFNIWLRSLGLKSLGED